MMSYEQVYPRSIANPAAFWGECAEQLHWYRKWDRVLDDSNAPFYRWFVGGETNHWMKECDLSSLRHFFTAGEPLDEPTYHWASAALGLLVIDHYWQTESGWPMLTNSVEVYLGRVDPMSQIIGVETMRMHTADVILWCASTG